MLHSVPQMWCTEPYYNASVPLTLLSLNRTYSLHTGGHISAPAYNSSLLFQNPLFFFFDLFSPSIKFTQANAAVRFPQTCLNDTLIAETTKLSPLLNDGISTHKWKRLNPTSSLETRSSAITMQWNNLLSMIPLQTFDSNALSQAPYSQALFILQCFVGTSYDYICSICLQSFSKSFCSGTSSKLMIPVFFTSSAEENM